MAEEKDQNQEEPKDVTGDGEQPAGEPETVEAEHSQQAESERSFTPDQVSAIVQERLAKQKAKYEDYDQLKQLAAKWKEHEEAQKSELQKAQERADAAERERAEALQAANDRLIRAAFLAEAAKVGAKHPEDAYLLADLSDVTITDDGAVVGANTAVQGLLETGRLVLTGKPKAPNLDGGAGSGDRASEKSVKLSQEELEAAQKLGVKPEDYAKYKA